MTIRPLVVLVVFIAFKAKAEKSQTQLNNELYVAVRENSAAEIKRLVENGATINTRSGPGEQTPLMHAVLTGNERAVAQLLELGASTTIGEKDGYRPMDGAGFQGRAAIARMLAKWGVPLDEAHPRDNYRPVQRSCWGRERRHAETVAAFLELGVELTATQCQTKNPYTLKVLSEHGLVKGKSKSDL